MDGRTDGRTGGWTGGWKDGVGVDGDIDTWFCLVNNSMQKVILLELQVWIFTMFKSVRMGTYSFLIDLEFSMKERLSAKSCMRLLMDVTQQSH